MKRKEIKWRREGRGTMIGRQDGIIFRIFHLWDAPERGHTVSCYDTRGTGREISTAGYREFTWEEAVEFCQKIAAGEVDLEDLRARFDAEDMAKEREAAERAAEEQKKVERHKRNERRRRELARRRIITLACAAVLLLAIVWAIATACTAQENEPEKEVTDVDPVVFVTPPIGEDPMEAEKIEAEKIEAALLAQGYLSDAVPLSYDLQDVMRTACEEYGCSYSLALAVAEVESHFDMDAVGSAGEVGIMQLNPGPENTYWVNLEAETNQDPTTPAGNIVCGVYLLGAHLVHYGDTEKAVMAYNMGNAGAERAWENGVTSTEYSEKVMEAMARWEAVVG